MNWNVRRTGQTAESPQQIVFGRDAATGLHLPNRHVRRAQRARLRKINVGLAQKILTAPTGDTWPRCCICQREVEEIELVERRERMVQVLVRCHGAEELKTIAMEDGWDANQGAIESAMCRMSWFDPTVELAST